MKRILILFSLILCLGEAKAQDWYITYNYSRFAPLGFSLGYMPENIGGYASLKTGLASLRRGSEHYTIDTPVEVYDYDSHGTKRSSYTLGIIFGQSDEGVAAYGGIGYGSYGKAWGDRHRDKAEIVTDEFSGVEFELGALYRTESWVFGVGGIIMKGTNVRRSAMLFDVSLQVGVRF